MMQITANPIAVNLLIANCFTRSSIVQAKTMLSIPYCYEY